MGPINKTPIKRHIKKIFIMVFIKKVKKKCYLIF